MNINKMYTLGSTLWTAVILKEHVVISKEQCLSLMKDSTCCASIHNKVKISFKKDFLLHLHIP